MSLARAMAFAYLIFSPKLTKPCSKNTSPPPRLYLILSGILLICFALPCLSQGTTDCNATALYSVPANTTVNVSSWYPGTSFASNVLLEVGANATLQIDKNMTFINCKIRCLDEASIVTTGTGILFASSNTNYFGCTDLWSGITVTPGDRIYFFNGGRISDARRALFFPPGYNDTKNVFRSHRFENNLIGIQVGDANSASANVGFTQCWGNSFRKNQTLLTGASTTLVSGTHVTGNSTLRFGTAGGSKNLFEDMNYGIRVNQASFLLVVNTDFQNMQGAGARGIECIGSFLTVTRPANNSIYNCTFDENQDAGVFISGAAGPVRIEYANFTGLQNNGIRYEKTSNIVPVNFDNNNFTLRRPNLYAIYLERPPHLTPSSISRNHIEVSNFFGDCQTRSLIHVVGDPGARSALTIYHNFLQNFTPCNNAHGIYVSGPGDNCRVFYDTLYYSALPDLLGSVNPEHATLGIVFTDMPGDGNYIRYNYIRSLLGSTAADININTLSYLKCAIHVVNCNAPQICNNDINDTYRGIHFGDLNPGTIFAENKFQRHAFGNYYGGFVGNTNISNQIRRENTWSTNPNDYVAGGVGARYADATSVPFRFFYDPTFVNHVPPSGSPMLSTWFIDQTGTPNGCPTQPPPTLTEIDIDIAKGIYPHSNAAANWDQQRQLLYKLTRYPELIDDDENVEIFYDEQEGSSARQFAEALVGLEQAFVAAPEVSAALDSLFALHDTTISVILQLDGEIGQDTVTLDEDAVADLETEQSKLAGINTAIATWMATYIEDRNDALQTLENGISVLPDTLFYEVAWKTLLKAAIKRGRGDELDSLERLALIEIATTCPEVIGVIWNAVLPFMPAGDAEPYLGRESDEGCIEERGMKLPDNFTIGLSPNPAVQQITVSLPGSQGGKWIILDASGQVISSRSENKGQKTIDINLDSHISGVYFFQFTDVTGQRHTAKFVVVK